MRGKFRLMGFLIAIAIMVQATAAYAIMPIPPYRTASPGDYYQVVFDGEGEASVLARLDRMNTDREPIDGFVIEIPGQVRMRYVFQQTGYEWNPRYEPVKYREEVLSKSSRYVISLPEPIEPGETVTIILNYKVWGYVSRFVNYDFDFETIKSPTDIEYIRVAVSTDSELYMRGGEVRTDYRNNFATFGVAAEMAVKEDIGAEKAYRTIQKHANSIRYAGGYVKEKRNLDPWESFHVAGTYNYASWWFLTYLWEIAGLAALLLAFRFLLFGRVRSAFRQRGISMPADRFTRTGFMGLVSAVSVLLVSWIMFSFASMNWMPWHIQQVFEFVILMVMGISVLAAFFGPAAYIGRKYGFQEGLLTLASTVVWLIVIMWIIGAFSAPHAYYDASVIKTVPEIT